MKTILIAGSAIVTLALTSYSIAIFTEQRKRLITNRVIIFLTSGVILDITATICMIIGSTNSPITFHGFLGYSALLLMLIDTLLIWKFRNKFGSSQQVSSKLHLYSRIAYIWWVIAYITGSLIVMIRHAG